jgi:hypothetical protein
MKAFIIAMMIVCILMTIASCEKSDADILTGNESTELEATEPSTSTTTSADDTNSADESEATEPSTSTTPADDTSSEVESQLAETLMLAEPNTVLLDSNGVKLTALGFGDQTNESYVVIDVQIENNNTHNVNVMLHSLTVNGYLISGKLDSFTTKAGAKQIVPFTISKRDIEFAEIDVIREIKVSFYAKDANFDLFISPTEPVSLKTTKFDTPAPELDTSGVQVYNENGSLIVVKEELSADSRYVLAKLLIRNSTDSRISVSCDKLLVNGKEIAYFNCIRYGNVPGGIISYNSMDIEKSELEQLGIQEIDSIEMTLKIISSDYTLIAGNLTVTIDY